MNIYIKTYGCQMNERDSDAAAAMLKLGALEAPFADLLAGHGPGSALQEFVYLLFSLFISISLVWPR